MHALQGKGLDGTGRSRGLPGMVARLNRSILAMCWQTSVGVFGVSSTANNGSSNEVVTLRVSCMKLSSSECDLLLSHLALGCVLLIWWTSSFLMRKPEACRGKAYKKTAIPDLTHPMIPKFWLRPGRMPAQDRLHPALARPRLVLCRPAGHDKQTQGAGTPRILLFEGYTVQGLLTWDSARGLTAVRCRARAGRDTP